MKKYYYTCFTCGATWSSDEIEGHDHYLCPHCADKNKLYSPLIGCLSIHYDYDNLKARYDKNFFMQTQPGNIFRFPLLLPLKKDPPEIMETRTSLPIRSLYRIDDVNYHDVYVLDETHNPTYSYKDRASVLVLAKAIELGKDTICTASTGNAASSISGLCAMVSVRSKIYVPKTIPLEKFTQIRMYGADVEKIDGCYDDAYDISIEESH